MHILEKYCHPFQDWEYPRKNLVYLKELGEGEFGKVLLMKAQVGIHDYYSSLTVHLKYVIIVI